jgi:hypothetical protein
MPAVPPYVCVASVCTAVSPAVDFTFKTLQTLINFGIRRLVQLGKAAAAPLTVDGRIDQRTLNAYLPIAREAGGKLAIIDFAPTPEYLARYADVLAYEIAKWARITWVPATATVPGHWEPLRAGQAVTLPVYQPRMAAPVCPPGTVATSAGCVTVTPTGTKEPTPTGTKEPTPTGTKEPTPTGTKEPTPTEAKEPTPTGTKEPTPTGTKEPTPTGTKEPTPTEPMPSDFVPEASPPPPSAQPPTEPVKEGRYKGCIARFNRTRKVYSIYCPVGSVGAQPGRGLGEHSEYFRCLQESCIGLGESDVTPPPPSGYVKAAEVTTLPGAGEVPGGEERDKFFRWKNPLMWAMIVGTVAAAGGGYVLYRRRRGTDK